MRRQEQVSSRRRGVGGRRPGLLALALLAGGGPAALAEGELPPGLPAWTWQVDLGTTLLSRSSGPTARLRLARAQALGASLDRRWAGWHAFFRGEGNGWSDERDDGSHDHAFALNLGLGLGLDHGGGRLRSSVAAGTSLLLVPPDVDEAPSAGVFLDLRPLALFWPIGSGLRIGLQPLSLTVALPVLTGIPLISLQYRTTVLVEGGL